MSDTEKPEADDKTHDASAARLEKARRDGDIPQSREANAAASYLGFYLAVAFAASGGVSIFAATQLKFLSAPESISRLVFENSHDFIGDLAVETLSQFSPLFFLPLACVLGSLFAQRAISFAPSKLQPNLSRISITANAKKKFGPDGLSEFLKSTVKLCFVFILFGFIFFEQFTALPGEARRPPNALPLTLLQDAILFLGMIVIFSAVVAMIDLPWIQHQHKQRLRMTFDEAKREAKENEGDPALKQKRRNRAQSIATNRMLHDVPKADVVIVNPTHFAVALRWDRGKPGAPVCVAKGVDEIAARIREVAAISGVPLKRDPPTARALHASVEIGDMIKREHFAAVAAAIQFADLMRAKAASTDNTNRQGRPSRAHSE